MGKMERILLSWNPENDWADWLRIDRYGNRVGPIVRQGRLEELAPIIGVASVCWVLPGERVRTVSASLPVRGAEKLRAALPYALEEQFAADPERLFYALAAHSKDQPVQAAVSEGAWLDEGLARLADFKVFPDAMIPDYLLLAWEPGEFCLLEWAGTLFCRFDHALGFTLESDAGRLLVRTMLTSQESGSELKQQVRLWCEPGTDTGWLDALGCEKTVEPVHDGILGIAPLGLVSGLALNMRQGRLRMQQRWSERTRAWWPAAAVLVLVGVLALTGLLVRWARMDALASQEHALIVRRFHQLMPGQPLVNVRAQLHQRLVALQQGPQNTAFLGLLGALAQGSFHSISIRSLSYTGEHIRLQVDVPSMKLLEQFRSSLKSKSALKVKVNSANQTKSGVIGDLTIAEQTGGGQ